MFLKVAVTFVIASNLAILRSMHLKAPQIVYYGTSPWKYKMSQIASYWWPSWSRGSQTCDLGDFFSVPRESQLSALAPKSPLSGRIIKKDVLTLPNTMFSLFFTPSRLDENIAIWEILYGLCIKIILVKNSLHLKLNYSI